MTMLVRLTLALMLLAAPSFAQAAPPRALVIAAGKSRVLPPVATASADAAKVAAALTAAGIAVTRLDDPDAATLSSAVARFAAGVPEGGDAIVYWRGHVAQAPARTRSEGVDNWLLGIDEARPGAGLSLGDVLAALNARNAARQLVLLDLAPSVTGAAQPGARALRRAVVVLGAAPGENAPAASALADAFAKIVSTSRAPAGEAMLAAAAEVARTSGGKQRPLVIGGGESARWVLTPNAVATPQPELASSYERALACGSETCLRGALSTASGPQRAELERRLAALAALDDFDPGATGPAKPRTRLTPTQQALVDRLGTDAIGRYRLGLRFLRGSGGLPPDEEMAVTWLERATRFEYGPSVANDPEAWYREKAGFVLGWLDYAGHGRPKNVEAAIGRWGRLNASTPDLDVAWYLGMMTDQCVGGVNYCQKATAQALFARARAGGVTRARSPLDSDFPEENTK